MEQVPYTFRRRTERDSWRLTHGDPGGGTSRALYAASSPELLRGPSSPEPPPSSLSPLRSMSSSQSPSLISHLNRLRASDNCRRFFSSGTLPRRQCSINRLSWTLSWMCCATAIPAGTITPNSSAPIHCRTRLWLESQ